MTKSRTYPWGHNRRYNSYSEYIKKLFGGRVQKISVDAGFTCPNRDGSKGFGGCTFCSNDAFNPSYCTPLKPIRQQVDEGIEFHLKRYRRASNYLVYFQAYTNTYKPLEDLQDLYEQALSVPGVIGIVIGTRPDALQEELLGYLRKLQQDHYVMVEFGVESIYDSTLMRINRGHNFAESVRAITETAQAGIPCGAHLIFGLPGETEAQMRDSARVMSSLPISTIKFHQLQVFKDTPMAIEFREKPDDFRLFSLDEYIRFIILYLEMLNPAIVIERFAGEVPPRYLVSESWGSLRYDQVLKMIETALEETDGYQGKHFK
jgi:uncharacterized protein